MKLVSTTTVTSTGVDTVTIASIPPNGSDLILIISVGVQAASDGYSSLRCYANSDFTASSYERRSLFATGSLQVIVDGTSDVANAVPAGAASNYGSIVVAISNYASTGRKIFFVKAGNGENSSKTATVFAQRYVTADPITSLTFSKGTLNDFMIGSTFSLYMLTAENTDSPSVVTT